ncbi:MAG TPA: MarR family transcriptional regulator [Bacillota bacterium]|nr:MarR family transcriptional regulator [Bacillota bacterium]
MADNNEIKLLRESVRLLERKLGLLNDIQASCCGVTLAQCHALVEIGRAGSISLNDLADLLGLDKSTMSRTINNLVNNKLVSREIDPKDRRFLMLCLTEAGRKTFQTIEAKMDLFFNQIYQTVPEDKRQQVVESLQILIQALVENPCCE